jgi:hypothetical protein
MACWKLNIGSHCKGVPPRRRDDRGRQGTSVQPVWLMPDVAYTARRATALPPGIKQG